MLGIEFKMRLSIESLSYWRPSCSFPNFSGNCGRSSCICPNETAISIFCFHQPAWKTSESLKLSVVFRQMWTWKVLMCSFQFNCLTNFLFSPTWLKTFSRLNFLMALTRPKLRIIKPNDHPSNYFGLLRLLIQSHHTLILLVFNFKSHFSGNYLCLVFGWVRQLLL